MLDIFSYYLDILLDPIPYPLTQWFQRCAFLPCERLAENQIIYNVLIFLGSRTGCNYHISDIPIDIVRHLSHYGQA